MDYFVSFNGHLVERTRPEGWPRVVQEKYVYRSESTEEMTNLLNARAKQIRINGGMTITLEAEEDGDNKSDVAWGKGKFIPMHMIAWIDFSVRAMVAPMPNLEDEGLIKQ